MKQGVMVASGMAPARRTGRRPEYCYEARTSYGNFLPDPRDWYFP